MKKCSSLKQYPKVIRDNATVLCLLSKSSTKTAKKIILAADNSLLKALSLLAFNIIHGYLPLDPESKKNLTPYASHIRTIALKNASAKTRRTTLMKAGFLPMLLGGLAASFLPKILKGILS